ncbi:MAG: hypothetical protein IPN18_05535 [Ignavibacteriales bacterium]|nr:hypothetical protein [Ignavibacteriales bacterium]
MDTVVIPDSLIDLETAMPRNGKFLISSSGSKLYNLAIKKSSRQKCVCFEGV